MGVRVYLHNLTTKYYRAGLNGGNLSTNYTYTREDLKKQEPFNRPQGREDINQATNLSTK
jgi:hypothetical protein